MSDTGGDVIVGRNAVMEALRSGREIDKLLLARGTSGASVSAIISACRERGAPVKEIPREKLDEIAGGAAHQGVALYVAAHAYCSVSDILALAKEKNEPPFLVILDGVEDPHNLGAIIRTAEAGGVHGVIIPERRSASLSATASKAACGALEYVGVARVKNLPSTIDLLKKEGVWVYGADMNGVDRKKVDLGGPCAIVIGNEGRGLSRLVREKCDGIISLPMVGKINSLNASVAAGILIYEALDRRHN